MLGQAVEHPHYGRGLVVAVYRGGSEWLVRFESGLRFRRPRQEFAGQREAAPAQAATTPTVKTPTVKTPTVKTPMPETQVTARRLVEALRFGVAPANYLRELTLGLAAERASVVAALNQSHETGGAVRAVLGEYGYGKSHLLELSAQEALARDFLVASASLDLLELPPHRAFDIYRELLATLRTPDSDERGLAPLLARSLKLGLSARLREAAGLASDPLLLTLDVLASSPPVRQERAWHAWLMGGRRSKPMNKAAPKGSFPTIYKVGHNARQIAYLLSGISVLARLAGYSGLCVTLDEAESYSLLSAQQRPRASLFFAAMIHAAQRGRGAIHQDDLPQHRWADYPVSYGPGQSLCFLFAVTRSENQLPLERWLAPDELLVLEPHASAPEIEAFLQRLGDYHARAYGYPPGERQDQLRRAAAPLALAMTEARLSIRALVRLAVELFDLVYLHPTLQADALLEEAFGRHPQTHDVELREH